MTICFATNNQHKVDEVQAALPGDIQLITLEEAGISEELPETQDTLEGNARQKATFVFAKYSLPCFADDTGLEVDALNGAPGVYSARYAGPARQAADNMRLRLQNMEGQSNRAAQFRTVIWLIHPAGEWAFEGVVRGHLIREPRGLGGFGYDPIFVPEGFSKTLAEMTMKEKNGISHRGIATRKLADFLATL